MDLLQLVTVALSLTTTAAAQTPFRCADGPFPHEVPFDTSRIRDLPGQYDLSLVLVVGQPWGATDHHGLLIL